MTRIHRISVYNLAGCRRSFYGVLVLGSSLLSWAAISTGMFYEASHAGAHPRYARVVLASLTLALADPADSDRVDRGKVWHGIPSTIVQGSLHWARPRPQTLGGDLCHLATRR